MGQWIQRQPMPTPRHDLQAITVDSKIYAVSGAGDETVHAVEIYDPQSDSWESGPPIPTARGWFGAGLVNGAIYAIGGKRVRPDEEKRRTGDDRHFEIRDSVERLDLATGTWSAVESLSEPRAGLVATVCKGRIYAIGGNSMNNESGSGGPHLDRVEVFDPDSGHWSPGVPLPLGAAGSRGRHRRRPHLRLRRHRRPGRGGEQAHVRPRSGRRPVGGARPDPHRPMRPGGAGRRPPDLHLRGLGRGRRAVPRQGPDLRRRRRLLVLGNPHAGQESLDGVRTGRRAHLRDGRGVQAHRCPGGTAG